MNGSARLIGLLALSILMMPSTSHAQVEVQAGSSEIKFSGRLQFQVETTSCTDATPAVSSACATEEPGLNMFLRRARASIEAKIDDRLTLKLEPDFDGVDEVSLKDAWGQYRLAPGVSLKAGHFKRPFDGFFMTSSSWLPFEREVSIPGVSADRLPSHSGLTRSFDLADRDIGFMFEGEMESERFAYWLGVFTGKSGSNAEDTNTEKQIVGRAQFTLEAGGLPLDIAAAVALTDAPFTGTDGEADAEYYTNFELWTELGGYDRDGFLVQAGLVVGDNPSINTLGAPIDLMLSENFASLLSMQGVVGYRIATDRTEWLEAVAPIVRVSYSDPNTDVDEDHAWGFTPGIALYFHARNRLALTYDVASFAADGVDSESAFRAQMQFHF